MGERNVLPHSEAEKYKDVCDIIDEFLEKESGNGWLFGCWRSVAFIIMKWIESVTNIALCQQVALDSVLETSYEQDTVKEFTRLEDLKNNSYHMMHHNNHFKYQENTPGQDMKGCSLRGSLEELILELILEGLILLSLLDTQKVQFLLNVDQFHKFPRNVRFDGRFQSI